MSVNIFKNGILSKIAGAVGDAVPLINNFLTNQEGKGAADANTVYVLNNKIEEVNSSLSHLNRFPDYSMGSEYINLKDSGITSYTIEEDGWVYLSMEVSTNAETAYIKYYINNSVVMTHIANISYSVYTSLIPVSKGDVITYQDDTSTKFVIFSLRYYPFK